MKHKKCLTTILVDVFSGNMMQIPHSVVLNFVQGSGHENEDSLTALGEGHSGKYLGTREPLKV